MPLPTLAIPGFDGLSHTVNLANSGRQAATDSSAVVLSTEDLAAINAVASALAGTLTVTANVGTGTQPVSGTLTANAGSGTFACSLASLPALAAGGNVIGAVTQSGAWNVGTVTTLTSLSQFAGNVINLGGGAIGTGTLRITQASDSPLVTATGAVGDAAWASGNGSLIAIAKTIAGAALDTTTPSPVKIDQTTPGTTDAVTIKSPADVISFTPTLDTAAYASGDVLFATAAISGVTRANDLRAILTSLTVIDKSKQAPTFTLLFYQTNVTSAAANAANALSDADQINCLGFVSVAAADYLTFANNSVLCYSGAKAPNLMLEAATGTTTVYVVGILQAGTPTFAVGDLVLKLGVVQS